MKALKDLQEMLEDELKKIIKKGDISPTELDHAYKAVDILKDIETIEAMKEYGDDSSYDAYSQRMGRMSRNSYDYSQAPMGVSNNSYDGSYTGYSEDSSYRRGRDAMGRYTSRDNSRDSSYDSSYRDGSYRGYSRHEAKEAMIKKLETMMNQASNEKERQAIQNCISELE